jgi:hypothetical protein
MGIISCSLHQGHAQLRTWSWRDRGLSHLLALACYLQYASVSCFSLGNYLIPGITALSLEMKDEMTDTGSQSYVLP